MNQIGKEGNAEDRVPRSKVITDSNEGAKVDGEHFSGSGAREGSVLAKSI
jgi:hypothetical protein